MQAPWHGNAISDTSEGTRNFKTVKALLDTMKKPGKASHLVRDSDPLALWSTVEKQILAYPNLLVLNSNVILPCSYRGITLDL